MKQLEEFMIRRILMVALLLCLFNFILSAGEKDWPMWRHDAGRSGATPHKLPANLNQQWTRQLPALTPCWEDPVNIDRMPFDQCYEPVVVGSTMYLSSNASDCVIALDTRTGKEKWRTYVDGPVRFPCVAWQGGIYVTSEDSHLYCLDAASGEIRWRFRGAPSARRLLGNGRMISAWPARGGAVLKDGKAYFAAGIWPAMGIFIYAVDAQTGEQIWLNDGLSMEYSKHPHRANSFGLVTPQGAMAIVDDKLLVPGGRTMPACLDAGTGKLQYFNYGDKSQGTSQICASKDIFLNYRSIMTTVSKTSNGKTLTSYPGSSNPVLADDMLYVGGRNVCAVKLSIAAKQGKRKQRPPAMWTADLDASGDLIRTGDRLYGGGKDGLFALDLTGKTVWEQKVPGTVDRLVAADDRLFVVTREGEIHAFGAGTTSTRQLKADTVTLEATSAESVAKEMLAGIPVRKGVCLTYDASAALLAELVRQSELTVVAVNRDPRKVEELRRNFDRAGVYGKRISVHQGTPESFVPPQYVAALTVCESKADLHALVPGMRPYGGLAYVASAAGDPKLPGVLVQRRGKYTVLQRQGPLPGAAPWTHQYGNVANTAKSDDKRVKPPFGVLWFGGSTHMDVLPRHGHGPPQQIIGGRMFIEGDKSISARDVYTGLTLWKRTFDDLGTFGVYYDNSYKRNPFDTSYNQGHIPGANARGTNYVVTQDALYLLKDDKCLVLSPETGATVKTFTLPERNGKAPKWGYVGVYKDSLIATSTPLGILSKYKSGKSKNKTFTLAGTPVIRKHGTWKYLAGKEPADDWNSPGFSSADWKEGKAGFGYGDGDDSTELKNMRKNYARVYIRKTFDLPNPDNVKQLKLAINYDDAFVAYLNGKEVVRVGVDSNGKVNSHEAQGYEVFDIPRSALRPGKNVLALAGYNVSSSSSDFTLDPFLTVVQDTPKAVAVAPTNVDLSFAEDAVNASASRTLVVLNRKSGEPQWSRNAQFNFRHNAIIAGNDTVYCLDAMTSAKLNKLKKRNITLPGTPTLYALDIRTGNVKWKETATVFGTWLAYSAERDLLIQSGRAARDMLGDEVSNRVTAYRASTGEVLWDTRNIKYSGSPILHRKALYFDDDGLCALDLDTGKPLSVSNPITGETVSWKYKRTYGCNSPIGGEHILTFRSGGAGFCDLRTGSTGNFGGFKSGCTSNLIPADGVLNAPDYTRTCTCNYQNQTSIAFITMPEAETWTYTVLPTSSSKIRRCGFNFGAPGDRTADDGALWLEFPTAGSPSPSIPVSIDKGLTPYRHHTASFVSKSGPAWVGASGLKGKGSVSIEVTEDEQATYTVTLYFAEPDGKAPSERVFDVSLQDNTVLKQFDPAAAGDKTCVAKTFKGVQSTGAIKVKLTPVKGKAIISGIELVRE